jgi:outer membrane lipoprotein-sorting protein
MQHTRYPISEIGVLNLTRRLIENGKKELDDENCEVKLVHGAKINGRPCTVVQVARKTRGDDLAFKTARILIDDELVLPVHYSAYDWPEKDGGPPILLEDYTYTDIKLNVGLTDWDFDHRNEAYQFLKTYSP